MWNEHVFVIRSCIRIMKLRVRFLGNKTGLSPAPTSSCNCYPFQREYNEADHIRCSSSIVVTHFPHPYPDAHFADCFHVVMLALWSSFPKAAHFAFCYLSVCTI